MNYTSPRWGSAALVVIDLQRDFLDDGRSAIPGTSAVVGRVAQLAEAFRRAGRPIVHVVRLYEPGGSDVDLVRRDLVEGGAEVVVPGTEGSQIAGGVLPDGFLLDAELLLAGEPQHVGEREVILFKPRWSAFYRTELENWLRNEGCDTVVVAGCNLPNCPRATLVDASARDFRTVLVEDAVSQVTEERVADLAAIGVVIQTVAEVTMSLSAEKTERR